MDMPVHPRALFPRRSTSVIFFCFVCHAACFPVTAGKLSEGPKEILEFCQTSDLMLAANEGTEGRYHGTRAPSIQSIVQVPVTETLHP